MRLSGPDLFGPNGKDLVNPDRLTRECLTAASRSQRAAYHFNRMLTIVSSDAITMRKC